MARFVHKTRYGTWERITVMTLECARGGVSAPCTVEMTIDLDRLWLRMAAKAARNTTRRTTASWGLIKCKVLSVGDPEELK